MVTWGMTPSRFWALPVEERGFMIQYVMTTERIAAYENHLNEKAAKKARSK